MVQIERAVRDGIDVRGMFYWTLIDNFVRTLCTRPGSCTCHYNIFLDVWLDSCIAVCVCRIALIFHLYEALQHPIGLQPVAAQPNTARDEGLLPLLWLGDMALRVEGLLTAGVGRRV